MIRDLASETPISNRRADVCIVGAGAAGIALAVELVRLGKSSVTLLEAGGQVLEEASQRPYASEVEALPHRGLHNGRFRVLGGTTTMWGGQILELDALDFEKRAWIAESGWPFSKEELAPNYARALELEGVAGALQEDESVWKKLRQRPPEFTHLQAYMSRWCPQPDFAKLHRASLVRSESIEVWVHANAVQLLTRNEKAVGVRCRTQTGQEATFVADEYVFCLGAIECSRFFLQPTGGALPWNESGLLGRHFQDHIDCNAAAVAPHSDAAFHRIFDTIFLNGYKYNPKLKLDKETQKREALLNAGATFFSTSDADEVVLGIKTTAKNLLRGRLREIDVQDAWRIVRHSPMLWKQSYRYAIEHRAFHPKSAQIKMRVHCEQEPGSASAITLSDQKDELGLQRTRLSWTISDLELRTIRRFAEVARHSLRDLADVMIDPELEAGDAGFRARCEDSFHHMGGMRMHVSPSCGVVDTNLRLHGTSNVYVCSSAVFPTSGFSNPTHTLLALASRLSEHLSTL